MKIGIMQPYFFPYIGYWQLINYVDKYVILDDVNYIKRGWINRNRILVNGAVRYFNVKINKASQNKLIKDTYICGDDVGSQIELLKYAYRQAPEYVTVMKLLEVCLQYNDLNLTNYLKRQIELVNDYLGIHTPIVLSSHIEKNDKLKGQDRIIEICKKLRATEYCNAIGGVELYNESDFAKNGIELKFLKAHLVEYNQGSDYFVPALSIIDVLMNNPKNAVKNYLNDFELVVNDIICKK